MSQAAAPILTIRTARKKSRASAQIDICDTRSLIKWMLEGGIGANAAWGKLFKKVFLKI